MLRDDEQQSMCSDMAPSAGEDHLTQQDTHQERWLGHVSSIGRWRSRLSEAFTDDSPSDSVFMQRRADGRVAAAALWHRGVKGKECIVGHAMMLGEQLRFPLECNPRPRNKDRRRVHAGFELDWLSWQRSCRACIQQRP